MATFFSLCIVFLISGNLFLQTNAAAMDDICRQTKNPSLCIAAMNTDPRSRTAALPQLAQITIDTAENTAGQTKIKIHRFVMSEKNPGNRNLYIQCEDLYVDALAALDIAPEDLQQRRYVDLKMKMGLARSGVDRCEAVFMQASPFRKENDFVGILADAVAIMATTLSH
ncbi:hypothetical protein ABFS82_09G027900 [Erythranthe guttata]|nr:PREDICTED: pectinesterase inhibitor-like [Erythranthe guttata]|eukprot:XP_012831106.1 PREDICTED: pectinesterase inhibitor-like [Erythranthe guttata]